MRSERQRAVVLLERTLYDHDYQPKTATGAAIAYNTKAEAHEGNEETILCRDCGGAGEKRIRTVTQACSTCKGRGVEVVDQYTGRRLTTNDQEGESKPPRMVRCDRCGGSGKGIWRRIADELDNTCTLCWGAKVVPAPKQPVRPFRAQSNGRRSEPGDYGSNDPILRCMEVRQDAGSYDELALALAVLRLEHRRLYVVNVSVYVEAEREEDKLDRFEAMLLEESLTYLESLMPAEIRVPSWAARYEERRRERAQRNEEAAA